MNTKKQTSNRAPQTRGNPEPKSARVMRFFYLLMLLLTVLSIVLRVGNGRRISTSKPGSGGTTALVMTFHHVTGDSCEDLVITAAGNAILSNCGNGVEKQYALSDAERAQLQTWIAAYSAVNYDQKDPAQTGGSETKLYLNGQGRQTANETDVQQLIGFAESLASQIAAQS